MRLSYAGRCAAQAWQRSQLCVNMDIALVDVLRSVRANIGELAEVQDILMCNRIKVSLFGVRCVSLVFFMQQGLALVGSRGVC